MIVYGSASGEDFQISPLELLGRSLKIKGNTLYNETPETLARFSEELMSHINANRLRKDYGQDRADILK